MNAWNRSRMDLRPTPKHATASGAIVDAPIIIKLTLCRVSWCRRGHPSHQLRACIPLPPSPTPLSESPTPEWYYDEIRPDQDDLEMEQLSERHCHPHGRRSEDSESGYEDGDDSEPLVQRLLDNLDILQGTIYVVLDALHALDALG